MFKNYLIHFILSCALSLPSISALAVTPQYHIKKILLVVAMNTEADPIISALNLHKTDSLSAFLPTRGYAGKFNDLDILLIKNGEDPVNKVQNIGTQAAAISTYVGIEKLHPDLIISIGTAGGVEKNGSQLNAIYASQKVYFFDRRVGVPGYHEYGLGGYPSADFSSIYQKNGFITRIVCSGDSFDNNKTDYDMFLKLKCSAIDMEAAGVAWVSMLANTPMVAIKGITNFVKGKNIHEQYKKNLPKVTLELSVMLKKFLENLAKG